MIHLKMIGLGLLTIFKNVGLIILALLGAALFVILVVGWYFCFKHGHSMFGVLILLIDLLTVSYFVGYYVYYSKKKAEKSSESNLEIGGEKNE